MRSHLNGFRGSQLALKRALSDLNNSLAEGPEWRLPGGSQLLKDRRFTRLRSSALQRHSIEFFHFRVVFISR